MPHLEKDLRQRRKIGRHKSERARQRGDVPKKQHCGRYKDNERQDHIPIPLLSFVIAEKTTKFRLRLKFIMLMLLKRNETSKIEGRKVVII